MDDCVAITLLRHGITEANEKKQYIGWTDSPLSRRGREHIQRLDTKSLKAEVIYTSPLQRCLETANLLFPHHPKRIVNELKELCFGDWEEHTYEMLKNNQMYRRWIDNPNKYQPINGESYSEFSSRVDLGFTNIIKETKKLKASNVVVVTHGGVIRHLLSSYAPEKKAFFDWKVTYGSGFKLEWKKDDFEEGKKCTSLQEVLLTEKLNG